VWAELSPPAGESVALQAVVESVVAKLREFGGQIERQTASTVVAIFGLTSTDDPSSTGLSSLLAIRRAVMGLSAAATAWRVRGALHRAICRVAGVTTPTLDAADRDAALQTVDALAREAPWDSVLVSRDAAAYLPARLITETEAAGTGAAPVPVEHGVALSLSPRRPAVAVLPFATVDPQDEYFGAGITEDITSALSRLDWLFVIARTSTVRFVDASGGLKPIAQQLGARYLVTGSIRRSPTHLRVACRLEDAEAGNVMWGESFDGPAAALFDFQDQITARVVACLDHKLRPVQPGPPPRKHPSSAEAYDRVLRSLHCLLRFAEAEFVTARDLLREAIALDRTSAMAHGWLSWWHTLVVGQGWSRNPRQDLVEAREAAGAALTSAPDDPFALTTAGKVATLISRDHAQAMRHLEHALTIDPNAALTWCISGMTLSYRGELNAARDHLAYAMRLSPLDKLSFYYMGAAALTELVDERYEEAVAWSRQSRALNSNFTANLRILAASLAHVGRVEEARAVAEELLRIEPAFSVGQFIRGHPLVQGPHLERYETGLRLAGLPA
jgi:adenylate cyclase